MDQTNYTNKISVMQITEGIEYTRYRKLAKFFALACIVLAMEIGMILFILSLDDDMKDPTVIITLSVFFGLGLLLTVSQVITYVVKMKIIENGVGVLPVYKVAFGHTYKGAWSVGVRFVVEIPDGSGVKLKTRDLFVSHKPKNFTKSRTYVPTLYVDDFLGKEVLVMYNPKRKKIYVLDLAENISLPIDFI